MTSFGAGTKVRRVKLDALVVPEPDLKVTVDLVRFLESSGFHCAWIADSPPLGWPDVYVTLGLASVATSRITLAPGVTNPELTHLRVDAERVARAYDVKRHVDPDAPHNRLVTDELVDALALAGTPERCAQKLEAMREAGAARVALFPSGTERRRALERFVHAVLPRLV